MDCCLPVSSVHGILQVRMLELVAIPFFRDLPNPGFEHRSLALQADSLLSEIPGSPSTVQYLLNLEHGIVERIPPVMEFWIHVSLTLGIWSNYRTFLSLPVLTYGNNNNKIMSLW